MIGKNFSCNNQGKKRKKSDFYETPYSMTSRFLDITPEFDKSKPILEPAQGDGAIIKVLRRKGFSSVKGYDIEVDFLSQDEMVSQIITNPPFSLSQEFILHAKSVTVDRFAFLLPLSYLHGKKRYDEIYTDMEFPLKSVSVFTRYPLLGDKLRDDGRYNTGMMVYAWFLWERGYVGDPIIRWIDNNDDVIGKNK